MTKLTGGAVLTHTVKLKFHDLFKDGFHKERSDYGPVEYIGPQRMGLYQNVSYTHPNAIKEALYKEDRLASRTDRFIVYKDLISLGDK